MSTGLYITEIAFSVSLILGILLFSIIEKKFELFWHKTKKKRDLLGNLFVIWGTLAFELFALLLVNRFFRTKYKIYSSIRSAGFEDSVMNEIHKSIFINSKLIFWALFACMIAILATFICGAKYCLKAKREEH